MPEDRQSRSIELFVVDIFLAGFRIGEYTKDLRSAEELRQDSLRWDATIRQLEIVGEGMGNILKNEALAAYAPAYFRKVVNFRNAISHGYFGIDAMEVWEVVQRHLPVLIADLNGLVSTLPLDIDKAVKSEAADMERLGDREAAQFLRDMLE